LKLSDRTIKINNENNIVTIKIKIKNKKLKEKNLNKEQKKN